MTLGIRLKEARLGLSLTLRDVERETRISNGYLSQLESDSIKTPSPRHLYQLANAYHVPYAELMDLAGYMVPDTHERVADKRSVVVGAGYLTRDEQEKVAAFVAGLRAANSSQNGAVGFQRLAPTTTAGIDR